jgi:hypothetical protein
MTIYTNREDGGQALHKEKSGGFGLKWEYLSPGEQETYRRAWEVIVDPYTQLISQLLETIKRLETVLEHHQGEER